MSLQLEKTEAIFFQQISTVRTGELRDIRIRQKRTTGDEVEGGILKLPTRRRMSAMDVSRNGGVQ